MYEAVAVMGEATTSYIDKLRSETGFDTLRSPDFWETWIALQLGGIQTPHKGAFDVAVSIWGRECRAEVKFSNAFWATYRTKGADWSRNVFKWSITARQDKDRASDAMILVGVDIDRLIYGWVVPTQSVPAGKRMLSATAPSSRRGDGLGRLDQWRAPFMEILPVFARICHNHFESA